MQTSTQVSWKTYAQTYDMLLSYNPFYQQVHHSVMQEAQKWEIQDGDLIADVGAGTGNYSIALAEQFVQANVLHIDSDVGMNGVTTDKRNEKGILNHFVLEKGIEEVEMESESLKALVSIHALYTFPDPQIALDKMYSWLKPGGYAILVDAGRIINVLSWQIAISWHLLSNYGFKKTFQLMRDAKEVSKQNAYIRDMQRSGEFWTHSHEEFCDSIEAAGFEIVDTHITFRGVSDFVVARKKG